MSKRFVTVACIGLAIWALALGRAYTFPVGTVTCPAGWTKNAETSSTDYADVAICSRCFQPGDSSTPAASWTGDHPYGVLIANTYSGLSCTTSTLNIDATGSSFADLVGATATTTGGSLTSSVSFDLLLSAVAGVNFGSQVTYGSLTTGAPRAQVNNTSALDGPSSWVADFAMGQEPDTESQT